MAEKKHSELYILKILTMYTDEDHVLSRKEIMNILKKEYDIEMDRRTFYSALHVLQSMSIDISTFEENHVGYYLMSRQFEFAEVMLLCHSRFTVYSAQSFGRSCGKAAVYTEYLSGK